MKLLRKNCLNPNREYKTDVDFENVELDSDGNPVMELYIDPNTGQTSYGIWIEKREHLVEKNVSIIDTFGKTEQMLYGVEFDADKIMIVANPLSKINETSKIFVEIPYKADSDGDFKVTKIKRTLNYAAYGLVKA